MKRILTNIFILLCSFLGAQQALTQREAFEIAQKQNPRIRLAELEIQRRAQVSRSAFLLEPLEIINRVGQLNSVYTDHSLELVQSVRTPKYYRTLSNLLQSETREATLYKSQLETQILLEIARSYNRLQYLQNKKKLELKSDSITSLYLNRIERKVQLGESTIMEQITARNLQRRTRAELSQTQLSERTVSLALAQLLGNSQGNFLELEPDSESRPLVIEDETAVRLEELLRSRVATAQWRASYQKQQRKPLFQFSAQSATQRGSGADGKSYDFSSRFQSAGIGISLPLLGKAGKALEEAAHTQVLQEELNLEKTLSEKKIKEEMLQQELEKIETELQRDAPQGAIEAERLLFTAELLSKEGEIDYLGYLLLTREAFDYLQHVELLKFQKQDIQLQLKLVNIFNLQ